MCNSKKLTASPYNMKHNFLEVRKFRMYMPNNAIVCKKRSRKVTIIYYDNDDNDECEDDVGEGHDNVNKTIIFHLKSPSPVLEVQTVQTENNI